MKYWRGYLVAAIFAGCTWGLVEFAKAHWALVDMVYPYVSRLIQDYLVDWSSGLSFCLWQLLLLAAGVLVLASIVLMVVFKWNPIQWAGWVLAVASIAVFFNTGICGLSDYAGTLAQDIRLEITDYNLDELEDAGAFYRDQANKLAEKVDRNADGSLAYPNFQELAKMAGDGFEKQTYENFNAVFSGSTVPVKMLGWEKLFADRGVTGITIGITGESAVHPQMPAVGLPFEMCRQMAQRMCISGGQDAEFAAFMACIANPAPEFQYAGYFMAYRYCYETMMALDTASSKADAAGLAAKENDLLCQDLAVYNDSFAATAEIFPTESQEEEALTRPTMADMLVSWHIQEYVLPTMVEEEVHFDPMDASQVDLSLSVEVIEPEETTPEETQAEETDA